MRTWRNEEQIAEKLKEATSHKAGEFCSLKYRLRKGTKTNEVITTRGIRFWSPIQVRIPQNRA